MPIFLSRGARSPLPCFDLFGCLRAHHRSVPPGVDRHGHGAPSSVTAPLACGGHGIGVLHVTGGNYSKGRWEDSVAWFIDGNLVATDDPAESAACTSTHSFGSS